MSCFYGLWYVSILCFITSTHTHTCTHSRQAHIDGIVMTRTCLIRPGLRQGSRSDHDSSIIQRLREPKRLAHMKSAHAQWRNNRGGWLLGHRCGDQERKWELFHLFFFFYPALPLKRNSPLCLLPAHVFENIPFPSTFPSPNLKPTLHLPPQHHRSSPPPSPALN